MAFYPWTISDNCVKLKGLIVLNGTGTSIGEEDVTNGGAVVQDAGDDVTVPGIDSADVTPRFKYLAFSDCGEDVDSDITYSNTFYSKKAAANMIGGAVGIFDTSQNGVCIGSDNHFYTAYVQGAGALTGDNDADKLGGFSTGGTQNNIDLTETQFRSDVVGSGIAISAWQDWREAICVPFSPYVYFVEGAVSGGSACMVAGLYQIGAGTVSFLAARKFTVSGLGHVVRNSVMAVDYTDPDPAVIADSPLVVALTFRAGSFQNGSYILDWPTVNNFVSNTGLSSTWNGMKTSFVTPATTFSNQGTDGATEGVSPFIFFLPTSGRPLVCAYVPKAIAAWHAANVSTAGNLYNPVIGSLAASYPSGFVMASPVDSASFTVINSKFRDTDGLTPIIPFANEGLNKDNSSSGNAANNVWSAPTVQRTECGAKLLWTRRYDRTATNNSPTGSYFTVLLQKWDPDTQVATKVGSVSGSVWDSETQLGVTAGNRYTTLPRQWFSFTDASDNVLLYAVYDSTTITSGASRIGLAKIADSTVVCGATGISSLTFAEFSRTDYLDFATEDFTSYFVTGYKVRGEGIRKWQPNYLQVYTRNTIPSTFNLYTRWDYAIAGSGGRWASMQAVQQTASMNDTTYQYASKRLKIRGHGKALQFYVSSVTGEPFNLIGWTSYETTNATI
jgi:hypothetical protein